MSDEESSEFETVAPLRSARDWEARALRAEAAAEEARQVADRLTDWGQKERTRLNEERLAAVDARHSVEVERDALEAEVARLTEEATEDEAIIDEHERTIARLTEERDECRRLSVQGFIYKPIVDDLRTELSEARAALERAKNEYTELEMAAALVAESVSDEDDFECVRASDLQTLRAAALTPSPKEESHEGDEPGHRHFRGTWTEGAAT